MLARLQYDPHVRLSIHLYVQSAVRELGTKSGYRHHGFKDREISNLQIWRRGWDSNSRNSALSHVIRCRKISVSKALIGITENRQAGCGEKHAQITPSYAANVA